MAYDSAFFVHESAYVDNPCLIGADTKIWHFSHIMANSRVGAHCRIGQNVTIPSDSEIGDHVQIGDNVTLVPGIVLEDRVMLAASVVFTTPPKPDLNSPRLPAALPTRLRQGARVGANATVLQGSVLGRYSIVEAGAVVTGDVPDHGVFAGNPMRLIGWSCRCGEPLAFDTCADSSGTATCAVCERHYRKQHLRIEELTATGRGNGQEPPATPLLDLKAQYATVAGDVNAAIREVCAGQQFILGRRVERFEQRVADYSQCAYGIGVSSGSDALLLALMALDIGPGDEVITTPYAFIAAAGAIARLGARPVFCDIEPNTFNLSPAAVETFLETQCERDYDRLVHRATGGTVRALLPVHLFGLCADMPALQALANRYQLRLIEDAAQAIGAETDAGRRAGSLGDIGCFSFYPSENLGAFGDAGLCTTNDPALAERLRQLRRHGAAGSDDHRLIGGNFRLDELQAAVLDVKLNHLDDWTGQRQRNADHYTGAFAQIDLDEQLATPWLPAGYRHVYNRYVIRVRQRDDLRRFLSEAKIGTKIYYSTPLHLQRCFDPLGHQADDFPAALAASGETLALPVYPELTQRQKQHVVDSVMALLR